MAMYTRTTRSPHLSEVYEAVVGQICAQECDVRNSLRANLHENSEEGEWQDIYDCDPHDDSCMKTTHNHHDTMSLLYA